MLNLSRPITWTISILILAGAISPTAADEVVLGAVQDATLYEDPDGALANGAGQHMFTGVGNAAKRAIMMFDIAGAVPPAATVDSVELSLYMSRTVVGDQLNSIHRITRGWSEGTSVAPGNEGAGIGSTPGDVTWSHTSYDTAFWAVPGGDFDPTPSAQATIGGEGFWTWGPSPGLIADVQAWLDTPATNNGWIVVGPEGSFIQSAKRFDTRENADPTRRPSLRIVYTPSTQPSPTPTLGAAPVPAVGAVGFAVVAGLVALFGVGLLLRS